MVRTKRASETKASRQRAKRETGDDGSVVAVAPADDSLQKQQNCTVAKTLGNAFFGEATSVQLVGTLTDRTKLAKEPGPSCNGFSQAAAWAAEPEWTGDASEETAETGSGGREPED